MYLYQLNKLNVNKNTDLNLAKMQTCNWSKHLHVFTATKDNSFGPKEDLTIVYISGIRVVSSRQGYIPALPLLQFNLNITTDRENPLIIPEAIVTINSKIPKASKLDEK